MADQSRLDVVEGRVEELSRHWDRLFGEMGRLDQKIDTLGGALSSRIDALDEKSDRRFDAVDRRFEVQRGARTAPVKRSPTAFPSAASATI